MRSEYLPQTMILDPDCHFDRIANALEQLGWLRAEVEKTPAIIKGEPEQAAWTWRGSKPYALYSFNPIAKLRVLDVATLPPSYRNHLIEHLPVLTEQDIEHEFFSDDPKRRLLALWASQETERIDLLSEVQRLERDRDSMVAEVAFKVAEKLGNIQHARIQTMSQLQVLVQAAPELIRRLDEPEFVAGLKPTQADCELMFDASIADQAFEAVQQIWQPQPRVKQISQDADIKVTATPAGLLRWSNELSDKFPGGYRDLAGWMSPKTIWLTWTIQQGSTVRYDGLAWAQDHWVWVPKIYRILGPMCLNPTQGTH